MYIYIYIYTPLPREDEASEKPKSDSFTKWYSDIKSTRGLPIISSMIISIMIIISSRSISSSSIIIVLVLLLVVVVEVRRTAEVGPGGPTAEAKGESRRQYVSL